MEIISLGNEIKFLRKKLGISQKKIAQDICTQSTISRIEAGEVYPSIDILLKISVKLQVPVDYLINLLFETNANENQIITEKMEKYLREHKYKEILKYISTLNKQAPLNSWLNIYLDYLSLISKYYLKELEHDYCIRELKALLNSPETTVKYRFMHMKIFNSIANITAENGKKKDAIFFYNKTIDTYLEDSFKDLTVLNLLLTAIFNKSKTLYDLQEWDVALDTIEMGLKVSKKYQYVGITGQLLYYKGQCYEKMNFSKEQIKQVYKEALAFFSYIETPFYIQAIKQQKAKYLV